MDRLSELEYGGQDSTIETSINCLRKQAYKLQKSPRAMSSFPKQVNSTSCVGISLDVVLRSTYDAASNALDDVKLTEADARLYLKEIGWDVIKTVYDDGKYKWMYKAPPVNQARALVFYSLYGAIDEYNNRVKNMAQGDDSMARVTIILPRKRPTPRNKTVSQENLISNKRLRPRLAAKKAEAPSEAETDSEPDESPAAKENLLCNFSDLGETDDHDQDNSPTYVDSGNRSPVQMQSGIMAHGKTFKELERVVNIDEAREYLAASGWEVFEVDRKHRTDWYYTAPASDTYRAETFQSLCGAISEYNSRVRSINGTCTEQKPVIKLVKTRSASHTQKTYTLLDKGKSAGKIMDEMEEKPACRTGRNIKLRPNPSPCSSGKQRKRCSSEETELEVDKLGDSDQEKISEDLLVQEGFAEAANTTGDVKSIVGKTFGTFVGDVDEDHRNYFLAIHILNLKKENMRIFVEKDHLTIKATYSSESTRNKFSAACSGALSCRLTLPADAIKESVTATQLKPGILNLTIPKSTKKLRKFEIRIE